MPSPPDRPVDSLEVISPEAPLPPLNFACYSGFEKGVTDLRWTSPAELQANTRFDILGVNIYRSFDSEYGPFYRLNLLPIGTNFYRDRLSVRVALNEDASSSYVAVGTTDPNGDWIIKVQNPPIVVSDTAASNCTSLNAVVTINGVRAMVDSINTLTGEIKLRRRPTFDVASQTMKPAVLPSVPAAAEGCDPFAPKTYSPTGAVGSGSPLQQPSDVTLVTYRYVLQDEITTGLDQKTFYRATAVGRDPSTGEVFETALTRSSSCNNRQVEQLDYIWKEAVRRNKFLLYTAGERAKVFIRKQVGPRCGCYSLSNKQPASDCLTCYGTGIVGGYDGPFDILLSPEDGERAVGQNNRGRTIAHPYETWTGPSPLLSQRDFVVKLNGDRYGIGPVKMPTNRGMHLQQFFTISKLDSNDMRCQVPVLDTSVLVSPQTRYVIPGRGDATPMMTDREGAPAETQIRGSTAAFENATRRR